MMEFQDITNLILNSGVTIVVIGYFLFRDYKYQENLTKTLTSLEETVKLIKDTLLKED